MHAGSLFNLINKAMAYQGTFKTFSLCFGSLCAKPTFHPWKSHPGPAGVTEAAPPVQGLLWEGRDRDLASLIILSCHWHSFPENLGLLQIPEVPKVRLEGLGPPWDSGFVPAPGLEVIPTSSFWDFQAENFYLFQYGEFSVP